jgi:putative Mg2+ transporter-C (MgtC) family protein
MDGFWAIVMATAKQQFSDIPDPAEITRVVLRLLMAVALAGVLGYERERRDSPAGLRTHMLVGLGAALFVLVPLQAGMTNDDVSRVLQGVIAGIGFLGAGAIIKFAEPGRVLGLTTAASIWATAAIGVACGLGHLATAIFATLLALLILAVLLRLERRVEPAKEPDA